MAFKMSGWSPFTNGNKRKIKRAKRLVRKYAKHTTWDSPDFDDSKFEKAEKKMIKAKELLLKTDMPEEKIEHVTGPGGYEAAMEWAKKKNKK